MCGNNRIEEGHVMARKRVDVEFKKLSYRIGKKEILKSICGRLASGQLTAILGSSGAGKTTLLDVLAGQIETDVTGLVYTNGRPRSMAQFRKIACYIRQEDLIQPYLTVGESMTIAADLKLVGISERYKKLAVSEILSVIGLESSLHTKVENLSGGQRKRLIIALELISDPSLIFLDEPTSGLDDVAMRQCVRLLKSLSERGATVVCTIHQPSDSLLKLFDTVYFMSDGHCVYNGTVPNLIPFLSSIGYNCPTTYNPADYIIELVHGQETQTTLLRAAIKNGDSDIYLPAPSTKTPEPVANIIEDDDRARSSFIAQSRVLIRRNLIQLRRNKLVLALHFLHNTVCGFAVGALFYGMGAGGGEQMPLNIKCMYGVVIYYMFTHVMAPILLYPSEVQLLEREHFNRWYSLKSYFFAYNLIILPLTVIPTLIFVVIMYTMTGQPMEPHRFAWFSLVSVLAVITSQGFGFVIGALFNPTRGACIGSGIAVPLVLLGMQGIGYADSLSPLVKFFMSMSFPYQAYVGIVTAVVKDRGRFDCGEAFCYFSDSEFLLTKMGMADKECVSAAAYLLCFLLLHRALWYLFLKMRLSPRCTTFRNATLFRLR